MAARRFRTTSWRGSGSGARREPLAHSGNSGAALERVSLADGSALIAKRVGPASDWLGRVTRDRGRTALLWEAGAFDRVPAVIDHGIEAVIADGDGWWVLMRDLSPTFLGDERRLTRDESRRVLDAAAALHAEFAGRAPNGAATLADRLGMSSLRIADAERVGSDLLPKQLPGGLGRVRRLGTRPRSATRCSPRSRSRDRSRPRSRRPARRP